MRKFSAWYPALILAIGALPLFWMLGNSLWDEGGLTLRHYAVLRDKNTLGLLATTISLGLLTVAGTLALGIPIAYLLTRTSVRFRNILFLVLLIPVFLPPYVLALAWRSILSANEFAAESIATGASKTSHFDSLWGCAFVLTMAYLPVVILFVSHAFRFMNHSTEEAARLDGNRLDVVRGVIIPGVLPAILSSALLVFLLSISEFGVPMILGVRVFTSEIFTQFAAFYNEKAGVALSLPLIVLALVLVIWERRLLARTMGATEDAVSLQVTRHDPGIWGRAGFVACIVLAVVSTGVPLGVLISQASARSIVQAFPIIEWPLGVSLSTAAIGATVLTILGLAAGYAVERGRKRSIDLVAMILFAVPATIVGIGLITFWNTPSFSGILYNTPGLLLVGYVVRFLILTERTFSSSLAQIPPSFEESARVDGATAFQTGAYVMWPLLRPAFAGAWSIAFIFCFGELAATILVYPAGRATLPITLYTMMANSPESLTAAISLYLIVPIVGASVVFLVVARRMDLFSL